MGKFITSIDQLQQQPTIQLKGSFAEVRSDISNDLVTVP